MWAFFKEPIIGPIKVKIAKVHYLENCEITIYQQKNHPILMKFGSTFGT